MENWKGWMFTDSEGREEDGRQVRIVDMGLEVERHCIGMALQSGLIKVTSALQRRSVSVYSDGKASFEVLCIQQM